MTQVYIVAKATIKALKLVKEGKDDFTVESDAWEHTILNKQHS